MLKILGVFVFSLLASCGTHSQKSERISAQSASYPPSWEGVFHPSLASCPENPPNYFELATKGEPTLEEIMAINLIKYLPGSDKECQNKESLLCTPALLHQALWSGNFQGHSWKNMSFSSQTLVAQAQSLCFLRAYPAIKHLTFYVLNKNEAVCPLASSESCTIYVKKSNE